MVTLAVAILVTSFFCLYIEIIYRLEGWKARNKTKENTWSNTQQVIWRQATGIIGNVSFVFLLKKFQNLLGLKPICTRRL